MKQMGFEHDFIKGREKVFYYQEAEMSNWESMSPLQKLMQSRKFLLMVLDTVLALVLYFGTKYLDPSAIEDVKQLILVLQPVFVTLIFAIAKEDAAQTQANAIERANSVINTLST